MTGGDCTCADGPFDELSADSPVGDSTHPLANPTTKSAANVGHRLGVSIEFSLSAEPARSYAAPHAGSRESYGVASWLDPANKRLPSAVVTLRAFEFVLPSRARDPSTVTTSPAFSEFRVQP